MAKKKTIQPKPEKWPKHMMGKTCGYDLHEDGSIEIAQAHMNLLEEALQEQEALDEFVGAVTRVALRMSGSIAVKRRTFWKHLEDDYGIDTAALDWQCNRYTRRIKGTPRHPSGKTEVQK